MTAIHIVFSRFSAFYAPLIATFARPFLAEEGLDPTECPAFKVRGIGYVRRDGRSA